MPFCNFICNWMPMARFKVNLFLMFHSEYTWSWVIKDQYLAYGKWHSGGSWDLKKKITYPVNNHLTETFLFQEKIFNLSTDSCQNFWMNREKCSQMPRCSSYMRPHTQLSVTTRCLEDEARTSGVCVYELLKEIHRYIDICINTIWSNQL